MTNLELANIVLEKAEVVVSLSISGSEKISESYLNEMLDKINSEVELTEIFEESVSLREVDDINSYIVHNIKAQIEGEVNVNEKYESICIEIKLKN